MARSFILHLHPRTIPADTARFTLSFGLGGIAATLVGLLFCTGILQLVSYQPEVASAYSSIQQMYQFSGTAGFIRNIHYWSGNLLVVVTGLHMLRVILTGALTKTRKYNWLIGLFLFHLVLFANFTGYLLPWDQLAYWAVTIFTAMLSYIPFTGENLTVLLRGGTEVGPGTLANFYAIHVGILPACLIPLLIYHFWHIRKAGGLITSDQKTDSPIARLTVAPHLIQKEVAVGLSTIALVVFFSAFVDAPLGDMANPSQSPNPAKAAWYFMGLQELLLHLHPVFAICIVPLLLLLGFLVFPFIPGSVLPDGAWFGGKDGKMVAIWATLSGILAIAAYILLDSLLPSAYQPVGTSWLLRGALPVLIFLFVLAAIYKIIKVRGRSLAEAIMAIILFTTGAAMTLTLTGIWFRGPGMALSLPF